jgi:hypothetical protein
MGGVQKRAPRVLPVWNRQPTPPSDPEDNGSGSGSEDGDFCVLTRALEYLDKRIDAAKADKVERSAACDVTPKGSQDSDVSLGSNLIPYSQDSKLSGEEPPLLEELVMCILDNLSEDELQAHFKFGTDVAQADRLVAVTHRVSCDLPFLRELVEATMANMRRQLCSGQGGFGRTNT